MTTIDIKNALSEAVNKRNANRLNTGSPRDSLIIPLQGRIGSIARDTSAQLTSKLRDAIHSAHTARTRDRRTLEEKQAEMKDLVTGPRQGDGGFMDKATNMHYNDIKPANKNNGRNSKSPNNIGLLNLSTNEFVEFYYVPQQLSYNSDPKFESIFSMGRNNPLYHYTSGEDKLEFKVDWFAKETERDDVILRCKKLESWTKNNGFSNPPPKIKLIWGSVLFSEATWFLTDASYTLELFHGKHDMMPCQAYQSVCLKRITEDNRTTDDILNIRT